MNTVISNDRVARIRAKIRDMFERTQNVLADGLRALPAANMASMGVSAFGRRGDKELPKLRREHGALKLTHRGRDAAVVLDIELYQELIGIRDAYKELHRLEKERSLAEGATEFDALLAQIRSPENRDGINQVFDTSDDDINASYRPGDTEQSH